MDYKINTGCKGIKYNPSIGQIQDYKRNWVWHVNRMLRTRLPRVIKNYTSKGRRNQGRPLETSGCARPEQVNKWPYSMIATWWWWWWWCSLHCICRLPSFNVSYHVAWPTCFKISKDPAATIFKAVYPEGAGMFLRNTANYLSLCGHNTPHSPLWEPQTSH